MTEMCREALSNYVFFPWLLTSIETIHISQSQPEQLIT
jgi:hypothetical protein